MQLGAVVKRPSRPLGAVIAVHGSGVTRHDQRSAFIADRLADAGICVMIVDLLSAVEARDRHNVFDADMQAARLIAASKSLRAQAEIAGLPLGYLGSGIGASVVLETAARSPECVSAVVVHGRPDAARFWLTRVRAPTLFIADSSPRGEQRFTADALGQMSGEKALIRVLSPGHCFAEPEVVTQVAEHARRWFVDHFTSGKGRCGDASVAAKAVVTRG